MLLLVMLCLAYKIPDRLLRSAFTDVIRWTQYSFDALGCST